MWARSAKSIPLSPQAREALGTDEERAAPTDLIRAILRAPVDLLWNGGIGTVVKASDETDADAHDRSSDAIRVDARELRARVVGEGGNLGFTRKARVEYSSRGGRINADFIDNSAGVDCSDHEVNLKILLGLAESRGEMTRPDRDELLEAVTEDVVEHVLYDSFLQAQIIGQEVERSAARLYAYDDLMGAARGRGAAAQPRLREPAGRRGDRRPAARGARHGAPGAGGAVAYAKRWVARALEASKFIDDPWLERDLHGYFPPAVIERCGHLLAEHPLRRQLLCMASSNSVVNALGPTFVSQVVAERGCDPADVVRAYRIARAVTGAAARWDAIEKLEGVEPRGPGGADGRASTRSSTRHALVPLVGARGRPRDGGRRRARGRRAALGGAARPRHRGAARAARRERRAAGRPPACPRRSRRCTRSRAELEHAPDMIAVAAATGRDLEDVAKVFFAVGAELRLDWLETPARRAARDVPDAALGAARRTRGRDPGPPRARPDRRSTSRPAARRPRPSSASSHTRDQATRRLAAFLRALSREGEPDLAGLTLAVRQLRAPRRLVEQPLEEDVVAPLASHAEVAAGDADALEAVPFQHPLGGEVVDAHRSFEAGADPGPSTRPRRSRRRPGSRGRGRCGRGRPSSFTVADRDAPRMTFSSPSTPAISSPGRGSRIRGTVFPLGDSSAARRAPAGPSAVKKRSSRSGSNGRRNSRLRAYSAARSSASPRAGGRRVVLSTPGDDEGSFGVIPNGAKASREGSFDRMNSTSPRILTRSTTDRKISGVSGGLAGYLGIDPLLVRIGFVVTALTSGVGLIAYLAMMMLVPSDDAVPASALPAT